MTRQIFGLAVAATIIGFVSQLAAGQAAASFRVNDLGWLAGCWESRDDAKQVVISEQWMRPDGGLMIGMGRTVDSKKAVDWELMRIEQRGNEVYFIARPRANREETPFKLIRMSTAEAVFENLEHDFPQRVIYRLSHAGNLAARIEGSDKGTVKGIDFPMNRKTCP
jgi:Domain of unknown function (DUF6265)